jgi:hypothetical protein
MSHYFFMATPTLWPGQTIKTAFGAANDNGAEARCTLVLSYYDGDDQIRQIDGPGVLLVPGQTGELSWKIDQPHGLPIAKIGLRVDSIGSGTIHLDYLTWSGEPETVLGRPPGTGKMWRRSWINAVDHLGVRWPETFHLSQSKSVGLFSTGTRDWKNYQVEATITPRVAARFGLVARIQGLRRYYALTLKTPNLVQLVKCLDHEKILAEASFPWGYENDYHFCLGVNGARIRGAIGNKSLFDFTDELDPLLDGGIGFLIDEGLITSNEMVVNPYGA